MHSYSYWQIVIKLTIQYLKLKEYATFGENISCWVTCLSRVRNWHFISNNKDLEQTLVLLHSGFTFPEGGSKSIGTQCVRCPLYFLLSLPFCWLLLCIVFYVPIVWNILKKVIGMVILVNIRLFLWFTILSTFVLLVFLVSPCFLLKSWR